MTSTEGWLTGYDAVNPADMPPGEFHFLYNDGRYAAESIFYVQFSRGRIATVCIDAATVANEYDFENGNPDHPVPWAQMMRAKYGYTGVVYCAQDSVPAVLALFEAAKADPPYFRIANWTGQAPAEVDEYGAGTVGVQYATSSRYDTSLISPDYPAIGPVVTAEPTPIPTSEEIDMPPLILTVTGQDPIYALSGGRLWIVATPADVEAYKTQGAKVVPVSAEEILRIQGTATV